MSSVSTANVVVLVHGILRTSKIFRPMSDYLTQQGWSVYTPNLTPNTGHVPLERLAKKLADYIDQTFPPEQSFQLVGLSMGGLVSRYYLQRLGGYNRVQRFITIATPHYGTKLANLGQFLPLYGVHQMRPNSLFLQNLNQDIEILSNLRYTSLWTPYDFIIFPPTSSQMSISQNIQLSVWIHSRLVRHPDCIQAVSNALTS